MPIIKHSTTVLVSAAHVVQHVTKEAEQRSIQEAEGAFEQEFTRVNKPGTET